MDGLVIPALIERAMQLLVADDSTREAMLGDWEEAFAHEQRRRGARAARALIWRDFAGSLPHLVRGSLPRLMICHVLLFGASLLLWAVVFAITRLWSGGFR